MWIGVLRLDFRLSGCHSLKEKRQVIRSLIDRLRHHYEVSVAEVDHQDEWQRSTIGVALVSGDRKVVERMLEDLIGYADSTGDAELIGVESDIL